MEFEWLGTQNYEPIFQRQKESLAWPHDKEVVWGLEHSLVITLGRRAQLQDELRVAPAKASVVTTDRGGLATLHGPGQLMVYPLLSLKRRHWGPREYVCNLLKVTKDCLHDIGIKTSIDDSSSGLFIENKKICFIGLRVAAGRVYHGLSVNVNNDLSDFAGIRSCGLQGRPVTSLREQGVETSPQTLFGNWQQIVSKSKFSI
jgi:lipoyl(octanoyl) transferase